MVTCNPAPDNFIIHLPPQMDFQKIKLAEYGDVLKNKIGVAKGYRPEAGIDFDRIILLRCRSVRKRSGLFIVTHAVVNMAHLQDGSYAVLSECLWYCVLRHVQELLCFNAHLAHILKPSTILKVEVKRLKKELLYGYSQQTIVQYYTGIIDSSSRMTAALMEHRA
ncbi:hypothetical protein Tco_0373595 [Tanacetum coccineum]